MGIFNNIQNLDLLPISGNDRRFGPRQTPRQQYKVRHHPLNLLLPFILSEAFCALFYAARVRVNLQTMSSAMSSAMSNVVVLAILIISLCVFCVWSLKPLHPLTSSFCVCELLTQVRFVQSRDNPDRSLPRAGMLYERFNEMGGHWEALAKLGDLLATGSGGVEKDMRLAVQL